MKMKPATLLLLIKRVEDWFDADLRRLTWGGVIFIFVVPPVALVVARWAAHHVVFSIIMRTFPEADPFDAVAYTLTALIGIAGASLAGGICLEARAPWLFLTRRRQQSGQA